jgi:hypothetical protein
MPVGVLGNSTRRLARGLLADSWSAAALVDATTRRPLIGRRRAGYGGDGNTVGLAQTWRLKSCATTFIAARLHPTSRTSSDCGC